MILSNTLLLLECIILCVSVCVCVCKYTLCGVQEMFCVHFLPHKRTATACDSLSCCSMSTWFVGVVHSLCAFLLVQVAIARTCSFRGTTYCQLKCC